MKTHSIVIALMAGIAVFAAGAFAAETNATKKIVTNMLSNGSFEKPISWGKDWMTPQKEFLSITGNASQGSKCLHMIVPAAQAAREGVVIRSEFVPCEPGGTYHISCDLKGTAPTVIVFIEAYDPKYISPDHPQGDYRTQAIRLGPSKQWKTYDDHFRIHNAAHSRAKISKMQVKVFAYLSEGEVWVDNVILEPAPQESVAAPKPEEKEAP
ncbi:MAG: hypothetical protein EXS18_03360 [Verrucomicrobiae bacterium]|nr:hypothetical protein [Verrucomicrobiae bacterium]